MSKFYGMFVLRVDGVVVASGMATELFPKLRRALKNKDVALVCLERVKAEALPQYGQVVVSLPSGSLVNESKSVREVPLNG